jgi:lipoprotein NlpD
MAIHPRTHTVASGETVYHIAHEYGVTPQRLMTANNLVDPRTLEVGQVLTIPADSIDSVPPIEQPDAWAVAPADRQFAWPVVAGAVSSPFGIRHGVMHTGVDIAAPVGTPVRSADAGTVIYAGQLRGYGNVIIVQHSGDYATVYGHNRRNLVRVGQQVAQGEQIGEIGTTGRTDGANLHFEVRRGNRPQNPLAYLPPPASTSGITFARASAD